MMGEFGKEWKKQSATKQTKKENTNKMERKKRNKAKFNGVFLTFFIDRILNTMDKPSVH